MTEIFLLLKKNSEDKKEMVVCEQQCVAHGSFVTLISTAGATELAGVFGESPWKDIKNRAGVSCLLSQLPVSSQ